MGLNEGAGSGATYLSIIDGKIVQQFKTEVAGCVARINKRGNTVFEKHYQSLTGTLVTAFKREHPEYGDSLAVHVQDGDSKYMLTMSLASAYTRDFLMKLPNINFGQEATLRPFSFEDKDKPGKIIKGITIMQDGVKVVKAYTKEQPNGLPDLEKKKIKGKETWDDSARIEFLLATLPDQNTPGDGAKDDDDLPF